MSLRKAGGLLAFWEGVCVHRPVQQAGTLRPEDFCGLWPVTSWEAGDAGVQLSLDTAWGLSSVSSRGPPSSGRGLPSSDTLHRVKVGRNIDQRRARKSSNLGTITDVSLTRKPLTRVGGRGDPRWGCPAQARSGGEGTGATWPRV